MWQFRGLTRFRSVHAKSCYLPRNKLIKARPFRCHASNFIGNKVFVRIFFGCSSAMANQIGMIASRVVVSLELAFVFSRNLLILRRLNNSCPHVYSKQCTYRLVLLLLEFIQSSLMYSSCFLLMILSLICCIDTRVWFL